MSRHLKLIAAVAVVLVALSGFSPGRKGGGYRSSGKSGGCSSSTSSSHNSSNSSYDNDRSYDSDSSHDSGSGYDSDSLGKGGHDSGSDSYSGSRRYNSTTGTAGSRNGNHGSASGTVAQCAARSGSEAKAVVEVRNPKSYSSTYRVEVRFVDATGAYVDSGEAEVRIGSRDTGSVDVRMEHPQRIDDVADCRVESVS